MVEWRKALAGCLFTAAVATAAGGAGPAGAATPGGEPAAQAAERGGHWHGFGRHGRGGPGRFCGPERGEGVERMLGLVADMMTFSPPQATAFDSLKGAVARARASLDEACKSMPGRDQATAAPARLAAAETMAQAILAGLREVCPAFDAFYATLDDKQKRAVDQLSNRRRHF